MDITKIFSERAQNAENTAARIGNVFMIEPKNDGDFDVYMQKAQTEDAKTSQHTTQKKAVNGKNGIHNTNGTNNTVKQKTADTAQQPAEQPAEQPTEQATEQPTATTDTATDGNTAAATKPSVEANTELSSVETPEISVVTIPILTDLPPIIAVIITDIAEALNIPIEQVIETLDKLGFKPLDLLGDDNLRTFIREVFNAETNTELLKVPGISETIIELGNIMQKAVTDTDITVDFKPVEIIEGPNVSIEPALTETKAQAPQTQPTPETSAPTVSQDNIPEPLSKDDTAEQQPGFETQNRQEVFKAHDVTEENQSTTAEPAKATIKTEAVVNTARQTNPREIIKQITEHIKTDIKVNVNEVKITLHPESLGELSLKISMEQGIVTAMFVAENQRVKEIIESNMNQLRDALKESGVDVGALNVSVSSGENETMRAYERERAKTAKRISKILANMETAEESEALQVTEEEVLEASVSYIA